ncbi:MAG TPA: hypothetical protein VGF85_05080 [Opitutaceae bacterium]
MRISAVCMLVGAGTAGFAAVANPVRANEQSQIKAAERDRAMVMELVVVSDTRIDRNPWRYASIDGFEVLTRANDDKTYWELDALRHGWALENKVIPKDWLPAAPIPYTVIVDDTDMDELRGGATHSRPVDFHPPSDALTWGALADRIDVSFDPEQANDSDTFAINTNLHGVDTGRLAYGTISLERVFRSAPPLPPWLVVGLVGRRCGLFRESFIFDAGDAPLSLTARDATIRRAQGPGTLWVSVDETERLQAVIRKDKKAKVSVPPMAFLFSEAPGEGERLALWESEAGLFVRWGLVGPGRADPVLFRAFQEFVRRARQEPVTERQFSGCFGFGYQEMEGRLGAFLKQALARPTWVDLDLPLHLDGPPLAPAPADDVARILGDWMRMQAEALRSSNADLSRTYLESAGKVLWRAYRSDNNLPPDGATAGLDADSGSASDSVTLASASVMRPFSASAAHLHDPALLAVYGLFEHDLGNDGKAREFLEAAAKAGAVRPRAYLVLAKLRYSEAIGEPEGAEGRISGTQTASVLDPLSVALRQSPDPETYRTAVETWIQSEARPTEKEIASLVAGVAQFPRETGLVYRAAYLCASKGYPSRASALIDRSLGYVTQAAGRHYLEELRARLPGPSPSEVK